MKASASFNVLFAGDSITRGIPGASYFELMAACIAANPQWKGARPINTGRGGDTVEALLHRIPPVLERHRPRWAVLAIGHNDVWIPLLRAQDTLMDLLLDSRARVLHQVPTSNLEDFEAAYHNLIDTIQEHVGHRLVICTCSVIGEELSSSTNQAMSRLNNVIRNLAGKRGIELADVWSAFNQQLTAHEKTTSKLEVLVGWQYVKYHLRSRLANSQEVNAHPSFYLTLDGVHPNPVGAKLWADVVWQALSSAAYRLTI